MLRNRLDRWLLQAVVGALPPLASARQGRCQGRGCLGCTGGWRGGGRYPGPGAAVGARLCRRWAASRPVSVEVAAEALLPQPRPRGRISAGFLSGKLQNRSFGRPLAGRRAYFEAFPIGFRPKSCPEDLISGPEALIRNIECTVSGCTRDARIPRSGRVCQRGCGDRPVAKGDPGGTAQTQCTLCYAIVLPGRKSVFRGRISAGF